MAGECLGESIGWIVGESSPVKSLVIFDRAGGLVRAGEYVVGRGPEGCVLGIVENVWSGHRMLPPTVTDPVAVHHISEWTVNANWEDVYSRGSIRWLALLEPLVARKRVVSPKTPIAPGSLVARADPGDLSEIFSPSGEGWIRLGHLVNNSGVAYHIDANALSRHLAILAVTGGGKSNTVCILAKRIVGGLCGSMVVFDMHGEYTDLNLRDARVVVHKPRLNPTMISIEELYKLADVAESATNQRRYLKWAWKLAIATYYKVMAKTTQPYDRITELARMLLEALRDKGMRERALKSMGQQGLVSSEHNLKTQYTGWFSRYMPQTLASIAAEVVVEKQLHPPRHVKEDGLEGAIARLEDLEDRYSEVLDATMYTSLARVMPPCALTVFDLSSLDEEAADAVVSHYLRRILSERKLGGSGEGLPYPVITVIEEAHILVPRDDSTLSKYWAARIAREGRKFGVGLVLVSQRPKNVDPNVLSQTNNKIVLRMVEPEDIRYVQRASEEMSDDIASLLPTLNPGEAVVLGKMAKLPAIVKVDLCPPDEKPRGSDYPLVDKWREHMEKADEASDLLEAF
ncbi:MAG: ATP-binding protein [Desulfurococcales archaeon]|nr:ATP-binding protein [Desulfurococcales archaeon]